MNLLRVTNIFISRRKWLRFLIINLLFNLTIKGKLQKIKVPLIRN